MPAKKQKRSRTDTASEQTKIIAAAFIKIKPPAEVPMRPSDVVFFDAVIAERANAEWTTHDIQVAALLARAMGSLEREESLLRKEGMIHKTKNKYPVLNPRKSAISLYYAAVLKFRITLCLNLRSQGGASPGDMKKRRDNAKDIQDLAKDFEDDLIPHPGKNVN